MNYLCIDIGGTTVKIGILNEDGEILNSDKYSVSFDNYETPILDTVVKSIDMFLENNNIKEIKGIGVSATGQIDTVSGEVIGTGGNIKKYEGSKIKSTLENKYNVETTVINDANAAVLGELFLGEAKGYKNIIMITIGTGVGGGIVVNNQVLNGKLGIGGEIGHLSINNRGIVCNCNNVGCYEMYASMTALINKVKDELNIDSIDGKEIFNILKENESSIKTKKISQVVDIWIDDICDGIISLVHIFNPDIVLVGGAVSSQKELFIDKVEKRVKEKSMKNFSRDLIIRPAKLKNDAGIIGALYYHLNKGEIK